MADPDKEFQAVLAVAQREPAVMSAGDMEAYRSLLADSAVYMPPGGVPKKGKELRDWLAEFLRTSDIEWIEYAHGHTQISGDLAYHDYSYEWRVTSKHDGKSVVGRGKGIQILSKFSDGSWKLVRNIWNSNPSA
jgi:ketosteroid isomerase-like protein